MKGSAYKYAEIRRARLLSRFTPPELARRAGVSTMQLWRLENGRSASLGLIIRVCELLGLDWRKIIIESRAKAA